MTKRPSPAKNCELAEFAVHWETIAKFFHPPLPRSSFYDLVNKGKIVPLKDMRGYYRLNASLKRLGLPGVESIPGSSVELSNEEIVRFAFWLIDDLYFAAPSWASSDFVLGDLDDKYAAHVLKIHEAHVNELDAPELKVSYFQGVIDAVASEEKEYGGVRFSDVISGEPLVRNSP